MPAALKLKHVSGAVDYVLHCGGDKPTVTFNGAARLAWRHEGRRLSISMSAKTADSERAMQFAKQDIRRAYRREGVEVRA